MYYTVITHSSHLRTLEKCRKHSPAARAFHISLVFSNACRVLSQCNTRLRLLYLLNNKENNIRNDFRVLMFQQLQANKYHRLRDSKFDRVKVGSLGLSTQRLKKKKKKTEPPARTACLRRAVNKLTAMNLKPLLKTLSGTRDRRLCDTVVTLLLT